MILDTCIYVLIVGITSVRSYSETSHLTDDGCSHFRKLHRTDYTWSCEEISFCPKENKDLVLQLHTQNELSCDPRNSNKICCPKSLVIGHAIARRGLHGNYYPYIYETQSIAVPQPESRMSPVTTSTNPSVYSSTQQIQSSGLERIGDNTKYGAARSPQPAKVHAFIDCRTIDSSHLNDNITWTCQLRPCKDDAQAYFVKNEYRCDRSDYLKICCPEFKSNNADKNAGTSSNESGTTEKNPHKHSGEQPVIFNHGINKFSTTIKPNNLPTTSTQETTPLATPEVLTPPGQGNRKLRKFDHDLLFVLSKDNPNKNIIVSPASIKSLLAMLVEGSTGKTSTEILHALQLKTTDEEESIRLLRDLQSVLKSDSSNITLESQNRIYRANDVSMSKKYNDIVKNVYRADIETLNFSNPDEASNAINMWVNNVTHGLIPTLVDRGDIRKEMKLFLLNYVYFKANWDIEFNPMLTYAGCFYTLKNKCERVKFMTVKRALNYTDSETYKTEIFEIPFKNPRYRMVFMLPYEGVSVNEILKKLDRPDFFQSLNKLALTSVNLTLPRTTVELSNDMIQTLQQLGIKSAFGSHATLDKMLETKAQLSVNNVVHKARIEMTEEGAKAVAVSGGGVQVLSLDTDEKIIVNRPFLFFIQDTMFTEFLFEGVVTSPDKLQSEKRH